VIEKDDMQEGDLLFFKIGSRHISHVAVYIGNGKFVHAASSKGVMISDLSEVYYKRYYFKAGRPKNK
jgi:lipoprotein Spr